MDILKRINRVLNEKIKGEKYNIKDLKQKWDRYYQSGWFGNAEKAEYNYILNNILPEFWEDVNEILKDNFGSKIYNSNLNSKNYVFNVDKIFYCNIELYSFNKEDEIKIGIKVWGVPKEEKDNKKWEMEYFESEGIRGFRIKIKEAIVWFNKMYGEDFRI